MTGLNAQLLPYFPAVIALTVLIFAILIQSFLAGVLGLAKSDEIPGMPLKGDHSQFSFRTLRTYGNSVETFPVFAATLLLAVAAGAAPAWVNGLAALHVVLRLAYWALYYSGVGNPGGGPRTVVFVLAYLANLALALALVLALLK